MTPVPTPYQTTEDFLADLRTTLLEDREALVDWQIRYAHYPELSGARFCFRVRLPDIAGTDMTSGEPLRDRMVSGEPPDTVPEVDTMPEIEPPDTVPEERFDIEGMEDFCPITYLTYRKGLGCYGVDKVRLAARRLGLSTAQKNILVTIADRVCPKNRLYLSLQAIFVEKEDQCIHGDHLRVLEEARAVLAL